MYVCMYVYIYIYIYTYAYVPFLSQLSPDCERRGPSCTIPPSGYGRRGRGWHARGGKRKVPVSVNKNTPPENDTLRAIRSNKPKSGAGEEFLPLRARQRRSRLLGSGAGRDLHNY